MCTVMRPTKTAGCAWMNGDSDGDFSESAGNVRGREAVQPAFREEEMIIVLKLLIRLIFMVLSALAFVLAFSISLSLNILIRGLRLLL